MGTIDYRKKAVLRKEAEDATYSVEFAEEIEIAKAWEFDCMNDTHMTVTCKTGNIRVRFTPDLFTMAFPEDAKRKNEYILPVEKARDLYRLVRDNAKYWFALDMASFYSNRK